jgi:hypothetical protein
MTVEVRQPEAEVHGLNKALARLNQECDSWWGTSNCWSVICRESWLRPSLARQSAIV